MLINSLKDIISVNDKFKNAINLYLNLNKTEKLLSYIPTNSTVNIMSQYLDAVIENKSHATMLIGPYGKGKSHLLLVLVSILSLDRNQENGKIVAEIIKSVSNVDSKTAKEIKKLWETKKRFLPVLISNAHSDLNQAFLLGLHDAIKREGLEDIVPETFYSAAIHCIKNWENSYVDTLIKFEESLHVKGLTLNGMKSELNRYSKEALEIFKSIYPELTSGSQFSPMLSTEILPLFKSVNEQLCEEYNYSGMYIIFDEFSKFIESNDKKAVGNDMKLLQDICELSQESKEAQMFLTLVTHKSIKEYRNYLSQDIINSFTGIEGRLEEKYLITSSKNNYELIQNAIIKDEKELSMIPQLNKYFSENQIKEYYEVPAFRTMFKFDDFERIISKGCYPLNPISAYILLNISEKVAQNERTLFTFISKDEAHSMARYIKKHEDSMGWLVNADMIYDYFSNIFKTDISNSYVHSEWLNAEYAISIAKDKNQIKMLKCLALMIIINKKDELPAKEKILSLAYGNEGGESVLDELVKNNIIYTKRSTSCYVFKTSIGTDLKNEIKKRRILKEGKFNISSILSLISNRDFEIPKQYNQKFSMTRYFKYDFIEYENFLNINKGESYFSSDEFCDGKIICIITKDGENVDEVKIMEQLSKYRESRIIVIVPSKGFKLEKQIEEYEILRELRVDNSFVENNRVLINEIDIFEEEISEELNKHIETAYELDRKIKAYYFMDNHVNSYSQGDVNKLVSKICEKIYFRTPVINNELINKQEIKSAPIKKARKVIIDQILIDGECKAFQTGTSPEATIYRALFVKTELVRGDASSEMKDMINQFTDFIMSAQEQRKELELLINKLTSKPYGIRKGVLPLYLAYVLGAKKDDVVIYFGNKEVQLSSEIIINMCELPFEYSLFVSKDSIEKEKYVNELQNLFGVEKNYNLTSSKTNNLLIGIQRWFRALPQITRNFKSMCSLCESEQSFNAILKIKPMLQKADANPYEIIYEKIPEAFSKDRNLNQTILGLTEVKLILDKYMDYMLEKAKESTIQIFDKKEKQDLNHTLLEWYEKQSKMSKQGLYGNKVSGFMNYIEHIRTFDDHEILKKVIKIISEVYIENWNDGSFEAYLEELKKVKAEIESIKDENSSHDGKKELVFVDSTGELVTRYYDRVTESTGNILRNLLESALDDFSDLSVNDKTAILVEMIEKILK